MGIRNATHIMDAEKKAKLPLCYLDFLIVYMSFIYEAKRDSPTEQEFHICQAHNTQPPRSQRNLQTWCRMTQVSFWCLQLNFSITIQDGLWNQRRRTIKLLLGAFLLTANCRTLFYSLCSFDIWHMLLCGCLPAKNAVICPVPFLSAYGFCLCILC